MRLADLQSLDDDALGQVLAEAFSAMPAAEPARLTSIRDRLPLGTPSRPVKRRWAQIITIGVLTGSGLAAAWWGYEKLFVAEPATTLSQPLLNDRPGAATKQVQPQGDDTVKESDNRRSPIIFQQERY